MRQALLLICAALSGAAGCKRPEDEAARQRIFSPEQPIGTDAKAREKIDARRLADDQDAADHVLRMSRAEAATRLGAHRLSGKTEFSWRFAGAAQVAPDAGPPNEVALSEETSLQQAKAGDFRAKLENNRNQGFEAVWTGGEAFVKSRFGPFRKRRTDRSDPPRLREQTSASLATFDQLARGLKLRLGGETTIEGRGAVKYDVVGGGRRTRKPDDSNAPPLQWPEAPGGAKAAATGPDADTARRLSLWEKETPVEVAGFVTVDAETAAPLAWDLRGDFKVAQDKGPVAELALHASMRTSGLGKDAKVEAPEFEPDQAVPHAVKDPLRFLGKSQPAAGTPEATEEDAQEEAAEDPSEAAADVEEGKPPPAPDAPITKPKSAAPAAAPKGKAR